MRDVGDNPTILDPDAAANVYQAEAALLELGRAYSTGTEHHKLGAHSALSADDRYRALVEQIPAVVFLAQMEGGLGEAYVSPQIESILGFSQEEWLGNPILWFHQLHPDDKYRWSLEAAQLFSTGAPLKSPERFWARDGKHRSGCAAKQRWFATKMANLGLFTAWGLTSRR